MSKPKAKARKAKPKSAANKPRPATRKVGKTVAAEHKAAPGKSRSTSAVKGKAKLAKTGKIAKVAKQTKPAKPPKKIKLKRSGTASSGKTANIKQSSKPAEPAKLKSSDKAVSVPSIMESAQSIWLAGLGAFGKAQEEGSRLFDSLIKEGASLEQKTRKIATGKAEDLRDAVEGSVNQMRERTQETWDRLEQVFEDRVSRALSKLGVPGRKELDELLQRIDELNARVRKLRGVSMRTSLSQTVGNGVRRARDDLSDLARELEEAQHAAKVQMKRSVAKVKKSIKDASR